MSCKPDGFVACMYPPQYAAGVQHARGGQAERREKVEDVTDKYQKGT